LKKPGLMPRLLRDVCRAIGAADEGLFAPQTPQEYFLQKEALKRA
tara:strand:- start:100 stop:234 length:135 start_codon:yes stop_codon:yes gene_type:complete